MNYSRFFLPPMFGSSWWDCFLDLHFDTPLYGSDLYSSMLYDDFFLRPRTRVAAQSPGQSEVKNAKDKFPVMLNVSHFKPYELEVKVVDNSIVVHGKHEEKSDQHGFIQREFTRRYMLPEGAESKTVKALWNHNGILTIEAPKKVIEPPESSELIVPVTIL